MRIIRAREKQNNTKYQKPVPVVFFALTNRSYGTGFIFCRSTKDLQAVKAEIFKPLKKGNTMENIDECVAAFKRRVEDILDAVPLFGPARRESEMTMISVRISGDLKWIEKFVEALCEASDRAEIDRFFKPAWEAKK